MIPVRFPVLFVENLPTIDHRRLTGPVSLRAFPLPILLAGGGMPVGVLTSVARYDGPTVACRVTGGRFPPGTFVWAAWGKVAVAGDLLDQMTRTLFPGIDVVFDDHDEWTYVTSPTEIVMPRPTLVSVTLSTCPAWPDVYWERDPERAPQPAH